MILSSTVLYQLGFVTHINTTLGLFLQGHVPPNNPPIIKNKITSLVGEEKNTRRLLKHFPPAFFFPKNMRELSRKGKSPYFDIDLLVPASIPIKISLRQYTDLNTSQTGTKWKTSCESVSLISYNCQSSILLLCQLFLNVYPDFKYSTMDFCRL